MLESWQGMAGTLTPEADRPVWLIPLEGSGEADGEQLEAGGVWLTESATRIAWAGPILAAYPGGDVVETLVEGRPS